MHVQTESDEMARNVSSGSTLFAIPVYILV